MTSLADEAFTGLGTAYDRYRPAYPKVFFERLRQAIDDAFAGRATGCILDIGAGTGIASLALAETFPERRVLALEPNDDMCRVLAAKAAAVDSLSVCGGRAEALPAVADSVDLIFVGQALHWFDRPRAYGEMGRVLRGGGFLAVAHNNRAVARSAFLSAYEGFLAAHVPDHDRDYRSFDYRSELTALSWTAAPETLTESWSRPLRVSDFVALARTASYLKRAETQHGTETIVAGLTALAAGHARAGLVELPYDSELLIVGKGI